MPVPNSSQAISHIPAHLIQGDALHSAGQHVLCPTPEFRIPLGLGIRILFVVEAEDQVFSQACALLARQLESIGEDVVGAGHP
jgi:hypothetical protein